jgi:DNA-directed RNA polymerase specialized sigma24 family protein
MPTKTEPELRSRRELDGEAQDLIRADALLAKRCVEGDVQAWEQLYGDYHDRLIASARAMLAGKSCDPTLAEELATRVWYLLVVKDGELLLRYDASRGARLVTFLRALVRDVMGRHFRAERRRTARESVAMMESRSHHCAELDQVDVSLNEFLESLSPSEREFCGVHLLNSPEDGEGNPRELSAANVWQKTHRVYRRFVEYFEE